MTKHVEMELTEEEEISLLEEFEKSMGEFNYKTEVEDRKCKCGGIILPLYEDNPHFGTYCTKCD